MAWGGNEKPLVFSSPGAHCCLTFCRQTFKGSFLFCTGGVAYREGRIALPAWRVDPSPTWCSAGPAIQAQLCPTDLSPAPGFNYSDSASFPRGWEMQYAWECLCYRRQDSPAGTEGQFGEGEGSAWHRCAQNWSILGGRDPQMWLCSSCRAWQSCDVWPCHAHIVLHTWNKVLTLSLECQTHASDPSWHKMHSCSSWTRQDLAALCSLKAPKDPLSVHYYLTFVTMEWVQCQGWCCRNVKTLCPSKSFGWNFADLTKSVKLLEVLCGFPNSP